MDTTRSANSTVEVEAYIREISEKATAYMSTDSVWNRDELKDAVSSIVDKGKGVFCCLLGGKNTGKSLVLSELMNQTAYKSDCDTNRSIVLVDLRDKDDILSGLISSLESSPSKYFEEVEKFLFKAVQVKFPLLNSTVMAGFSISDLAERVISTKKTDIEKLSLLLVEVAKVGMPNAAGCGLTVIIDEANEAFTQTSDKKAARNTLSVFIKLTKQTNKVSNLMTRYLICIQYYSFLICYIIRVCILSD